MPLMPPPETERSPAHKVNHQPVLDVHILRPDTPLTIGSALTRPTARFHLRKKIGEGSFGSVFEAVDTAAPDGARAGRRVAIKMLKDMYHTRHDALCALRELSIMRQCAHPNIIGNSVRRMHRKRQQQKAAAAAEDLPPPYHPVLEPPPDVRSDARVDRSLWFVMDLCNSRDLGFMMDRGAQKRWEGEWDTTNGAPSRWGLLQATSILCQLFHGLEYLHRSNIVHRDLKPSNLLLETSDDLPGGLRLRICDFGLSRQIRPEPRQQWQALSKGFTACSKQQQMQHHPAAVEARAAAAAAAAAAEAPPGLLPPPGLGLLRQKTTGAIATRHYRAPEMLLLASEYNQAIDVWSAGCILGELLRSVSTSGPPDETDDESPMDRRPPPKTAPLFKGFASYPLLSGPGDETGGASGLPAVGTDVASSDDGEAFESGTPSTEQIRSMGAPGCSVPGAYTEVLVKHCRSHPRAERLLHREFRQAPASAVAMLRGMLKFVPAERLSIEEAFKSPLLKTPLPLPEAQQEKASAARGVGDYIVDWLKREHGSPEPESEERSSSALSSPLPFPPSVVRFQFEGITGTTASLEPFIEAEIRGAPSGLHRAVSDVAAQGQAIADSLAEEMPVAFGSSCSKLSRATSSGTMSPTQAPAKRPRTSASSE